MKRVITTVTLMVSAMLFGVVSQLTAVEVYLSKKQVKELAVTARTPEDHMKLAAYYNQEAAALEAEANEHEALAANYRGLPATTGSKAMMGGKTAEHCAYFAKSVREAAKADRGIAAEHEDMSKGAEK